MNKTNNYKFTIIVPIYNEEENIEKLSSVLNEYLSECSISACVLFVNDGSKDNSLELIKESCKKYSNLYYINFESNKGLSAAIKAGIDNTESQYVGYMDADMQTDVRDFELLIPYLDKYKLVTGIRANRKDTPFKRIQSKIANSFRRMMTNDGATDTGCPLKIIHTNYARRIPFFTGMHRFLPALIILQDEGNYYETPVRHYPRQAGKSKYNMWNRLISPFKDCFAYRWMKHRYINYKINDNNL